MEKFGIDKFHWKSSNDGAHDVNHARSSAGDDAHQHPSNATNVPEGTGSGNGTGMDFEDRLGTVLTKLKPDDMDELV